MTRNVRLQATLANPKVACGPACMSNVAAVLPRDGAVLMIPATAVLYAPYGDSVFVIEDKKDEKTGEDRQGGEPAISCGSARRAAISWWSPPGLKAEQTIVSTGVFKLRNGMSVWSTTIWRPRSSSRPSRRIRDGPAR